MSYTNKTTYLNLPQWESSDKPDMSDYNEAFRIIDEIATPMEVKEIPLNEKYTDPSGRSSYYKTSNGLVIVCISVVCDKVLNNDVVGVLPTGYRPQSITTVPAVYHYPFASGLVHVYPNGKIIIRADVSEQHTQCYAQVVFAAAKE